MLASLFTTCPSFEESVHLFKSWGFVVEPGPQPDEITLILEGPDYRTYSVHPCEMLPQMAAVALNARYMNGTLCSMTSRSCQMA